MPDQYFPLTYWPFWAILISGALLATHILGKNLLPQSLPQPVAGPVPAQTGLTEADMLNDPTVEQIKSYYRSVQQSFPVKVYLSEEYYWANGTVEKGDQGSLVICFPGMLPEKLKNKKAAAAKYYNQKVKS